MTGMGYPGMPMGGVGMEPPAEPSGLQVRAGGGWGGRGGKGHWASRGRSGPRLTAAAWPTCHGLTKAMF